MASTVLDHVTGGLCLLFMYRCIYAWLTSTGPVVMVFGYFFMPCVFCALIVMIASGSLVILIYVSRFRGGIVGARGPRSVRWSGGFCFGWWCPSRFYCL